MSIDNSLNKMTSELVMRRSASLHIIFYCIGFKLVLYLRIKTRVKEEK